MDAVADGGRESNGLVVNGRFGWEREDGAKNIFFRPFEEGHTQELVVFSIHDKDNVFNSASSSRSVLTKTHSVP